MPGGDPGKLGTFEGEENKALVQRLAQEWSSGSEDDMAAVERLAEEWTSGRRVKADLHLTT